MKAYLRVGFFVRSYRVLVKINGEASEVSNGLSIQDLLSAKYLLDQAVIVELNGKIIRRESWDNTRLNRDDRLEIIRLIGGG